MHRSVNPLRQLPPKIAKSLKSRSKENAMRRNSLPLGMLFALASCTSPPKPPGVDESRRHPVNATAAVELQVCNGQLQNTRLEAAESGRAADAAKATVSRLTATRASAACTSRPGAQRNVVYSVLFAYGSTKVPSPALTGLLTEARTAPLILLSGRTDGAVESSAESRIARERSETVRALLVQAGVDPARIRTTWQPIGDHAADNGSESGRRLNRRVEIEIYRFAPTSAPPDAAQS
jgi:outer membrane protein OmpA-like peptidoglycan-associated protein